MTEKIQAAVVARKQEWIEFCRELIRTPSPTYEEEKASKLIESEMKKLGYDDVWRDPKGNVIGVRRKLSRTR